MPSWHPRPQTSDLRRIMLHMIEETARHAGHLDAARELIDGRTGLDHADIGRGAGPDIDRMTQPCGRAMGPPGKPPGCGARV
jgi:hypothetical protein